MATLTQAAASDLFRREPDRFLDVGAGEVAHRCVGTGPDVLFVHGWPVSGATFRLLLPHLVDHVTCHVIDFPSAGSSRFDANTPMSIDQHVETVRRVVDLLGLDDVAVVGHDSGGLIARHAMAGDPRLRAMGLINTEPPDPSWRFRSFIAARRLPGFSAGLGWVAGTPRVRRLKMVLGDAFVDRSLLDGEADEFYFQPLHNSAKHRDAATRLLRSLDMEMITGLPDVHRRIDVPVRLVWGDQDPFFPVERAEAMVETFPDATIEIIEGAGLFSHEERPAEVAAALLPTLAN
ncbi:alpha/beta fold hydrolase [Ilumatobacter coccineus]|uniref:Putative hydrolase n=1 Tax=Ilumatobacter coccineus (strain NBRC 103263 / KCTC 29153 / YM16-304) TaxID=1313172 RepID=A0A6C7E6R9_ILUCY|nr:alpha/beta hydrolase [Ilumatobacter coccineus]BAN00875.1 putative hydrolase [Ilumatobacter coccineus YM16-304]